MRRKGQLILWPHSQSVSCSMNPRWASNPKGGSGLVGPSHCQHVRATKHLSMPILGKQAALRIFGDRCSGRAGSGAGRRMQRGHWRSWQDGQLLGTAVCSGTGEGSAGRGALSQGSGQEQMFPVGHCRPGFPEVHDAWNCSWQGSGGLALVCTGSTALFPCLEHGRKTWQTWLSGPLAHTTGTETPGSPP